MYFLMYINQIHESMKIYVYSNIVNIFLIKFIKEHCNRITK